MLEVLLPGSAVRRAHAFEKSRLHCRRHPDDGSWDAANATIFRFCERRMFRGPPVGDPDRVVVVSSINPVSSWGVT